MASAHCSDYAIEIPVARSLDADPSLVILGLTVNAHLGIAHLLESPYFICNAQPRQSRGQDLHDPETMEQAYPVA
jgi:hypothetical protein